MKSIVGIYFDTLNKAILETECSNGDASAITLDDAFTNVRELAHGAHDRGNRIIFIGNGGSAGITSHLAIDFCKNGGLRSTALNDSSALTCLGNDLGYENVFAKQIEWHAREGDLLIAISSSGKSPNILNGVGVAKECGCKVVTCSGFDADNPLRRCGDVNMYVRSNEYGFVEVAHLALLHAILDLDMGWKPGHKVSKVAQR